MIAPGLRLAGLFPQRRLLLAWTLLLTTLLASGSEPAIAQAKDLGASGRRCRPTDQYWTLWVTARGGGYAFEYRSGYQAVVQPGHDGSYCFVYELRNMPGGLSTRVAWIGDGNTSLWDGILPKCDAPGPCPSVPSGGAGARHHDRNSRLRFGLQPGQFTHDTRAWQNDPPVQATLKATATNPPLVATLSGPIADERGNVTAVDLTFIAEVIIADRIIRYTASSETVGAVILGPGEQPTRDGVSVLWGAATKASVNAPPGFRQGKRFGPGEPAIFETHLAEEVIVDWQTPLEVYIGGVRAFAKLAPAYRPALPPS
jgi:hypothetical protein